MLLESVISQPMIRINSQDCKLSIKRQLWNLTLEVV